MEQWEAIQAAMEFADIEVDADSVEIETRIKTDDDGMPDGQIFKVKLTSDTIVWVHDDAYCEWE